ncbi:MAG: hypothetical protein AB8B52_07805 [Winogradskyella sp.]|uniref:hypothetical protein n=1 Tax=Winogradskyella sp. TaxID=1883156 RepID=UPI00385ED4B5
MANPISLPSRNETLSDNECFYVEPDKNNFAELQKAYNRKVSQEANNLRLQYFSIEQELINSFKYVNPVTSNLNTSSVKFASIIRESANLFEQVSRIIYDKLFKEYGRINIFHYLTLEKFLKFNDLKFHCPSLTIIASENPNLLRPYGSLDGWNDQNQPEPVNIPSWWTAYNKIKHSPDALTDYSTLENSIQSLLASYIIINRYLGPGVISGSLLKPEDNAGEIIQRQITVEQSELFIDTLTLMGYVT